MKKRANLHFDFVINKNLLPKSKRSNSHFEFPFNKNILNSKRSQSEIITTVLIILLVLAAIAIVWNIVKSTIEKSTQDVIIGQFAIDLEIKSIYISEDNQVAYVSIKRGTGEGNISALYFIFIGSSYIYRYPLNEIPSELESKIYNITASAVQAQNPGFSDFASIKSVSLALEMVSSGKTITTPVKSEFKENLRSNANLPNQANCCVPPYFEAGECTDGEKISCGIDTRECQSGNKTCSDGIWGSCVGIIEPVPELGRCLDLKDNDCDGLKDCNDTSCYGNATCCSNGVKDGNEVNLDCGGSCISGTETGLCTGGVDNDKDCLVDCADPDCFSDTACTGGSCGGNDTSCGTASCTNCNLLDGTCSGNYSRNYFCSGTSCLYTSDLCSDDCSCICGGFNVTESPANGNCVDGKNNDCDANQDCNDNGCYGYSTCCSNGVKDGNEVNLDCGGSCINGTEIGKCTGGVDNDKDCLVDCADPDCFSDLSCSAGTNYTARSCNIHGSASSTRVKCNAGSFYRREDYTNATFGTCADGSMNSSAMYIENIFVNATTVLTTDIVQVKCHVKCNSNSTEYAIVYNNGSGWINKQYGNCIGSGFENKTINIPIDNVAGTHYFRCWESLSGCAAINLCCSSTYGDNDDMKITVI